MDAVFLQGKPGLQSRKLPVRFEMYSYYQLVREQEGCLREMVMFPFVCGCFAHQRTLPYPDLRPLSPVSAPTAGVVVPCREIYFGLRHQRPRLLSSWRAPKA